MNMKESFKQREFERRFFSDATNQVFCKTFLENALRDPLAGKSASPSYSPSARTTPPG